LRRQWEAKQPLEIENPKNCMFVRGSTCNDVVTLFLKDIMAIKKPLVTTYMQKSKNVNCNPFIDPTTIEFFSLKADCSLFLYGSHSKKNPDNLIFGRLFEHHILDMVEFRLVDYRPIELWDKEMNRAGSKPCFILSGPEFQDDEDFKKIGNLMVDFFRGEVVDNVNLAGIDHVYGLSVDNGKILFRHYKINFKKSGGKVPRVELDEIGPSFDIVPKRKQFASIDLFKKTLPKKRKGKKKLQRML